MNEITLLVDGKTYRVTKRNNNNKFDRAQKAAGANASPRQLIAQYDKLDGYIEDEHGNKVENGLFWQEETERLESRERLIKVMRLVGQITNHPVISTFVIIIILAILWNFLNIDLSNFY